MILSSADILRILSGNDVIRLSAKLKIVDGQPAPSGAEGLFIYIGRFPASGEFTATWPIWIEDDGSEPLDVVVAEIKNSLPLVRIKETELFTYVTTTEYKSENTQIAPAVTETVKAVDNLADFEERFQSLVEDVQDRMLLVSNGLPGKDGADGKDGKDGRDGKDLLATDASLDDLQDVDIAAHIALQKSQVLTWDGTQWTNLFIPQVLSSGRAGGTATATATTENCDVHDGGDFDTGQAIAPTCSGLTSTTIVTESTYQVVVSDAYIGVNYNGLATITMPTGTNNGLKYMIKDESGLAGQPANYITIVGDGTDLIDSESSVVIGFNYGSLTLIWRDGAWRII
jgi:hypothetical protein